MSFKAEEVLLTTRFKSIFEPAYPSIPVDYPGIKVEPSSGKVVRFRITRSNSQNAEIGGTRGRTYGSVLVQIRVPTGSGSGELFDIADAVSNIFRNWRSGGLLCRQPNFPGPREDGSFIHGTVDVPYSFDYTS